MDQGGERGAMNAPRSLPALYARAQQRWRPQVTGGQPNLVEQHAFHVPSDGTFKHFRPMTGRLKHHCPPPTRTHGVQTLTDGFTPPSTRSSNDPA
jgi:hypothetical protein